MDLEIKNTKDLTVFLKIHRIPGVNWRVYQTFINKFDFYAHVQFNDNKMILNDFNAHYRNY